MKLDRNNFMDFINNSPKWNRPQNSSIAQPAKNAELHEQELIMLIIGEQPDTAIGWTIAKLKKNLSNELWNSLSNHMRGKRVGFKAQIDKDHVFYTRDVLAWLFSLHNPSNLATTKTLEERVEHLEMLAVVLEEAIRELELKLKKQSNTLNRIELIGR